MNIVICASLSQLDMVEKISEVIKFVCKDVYIFLPKKKRDMSLLNIDLLYMNEIDRADLVIICTKEDNTIGESVTYEKAYAISRNKRIATLTWDAQNTLISGESIQHYINNIIDYICYMGKTSKNDKSYQLCCPKYACCPGFSELSESCMENRPSTRCIDYILEVSHLFKGSKMERKVINNKISIAFDFDGVIHSYKSGWKGIDVIPDPPYPGIKELIDKLIEDGYSIVVFSARCYEEHGRKAIYDWLQKYNIHVDEIVSKKPSAFCYIDDRAINFHGQISELYEEIINFKTYLDN